MLMGLRSSGGEGSLGIVRFRIFRSHPLRPTKRYVTIGRRRNQGAPIHCERKPQASEGRREMRKSGLEVYSLYIRQLGSRPGGIGKLGGVGWRWGMVD